MLRAVTRVAPAGIEVAFYRGLGDLPLFNPDIGAPEPAAVRVLREHILASDALLIASPEYARGVTAALKNALDWMVGNETFVNKPVVFLNASPRATHAQAALRETVSTMSARLVDEACITVPILGSGLGEDDIIQHPDIKPALLAALLSLKKAIQSAVLAQEKKPVFAVEQGMMGHTMFAHSERTIPRLCASHGALIARGNS